MKISQRVSELCSGHEIRADGHTGGGGMDRQMDKVITIGSPPTSSSGSLIK